jgi:hypothetical protein
MLDKKIQEKIEKQKEQRKWIDISNKLNDRIFENEVNDEGI